MKEIWSQIPAWPDIEISTSGNLRRVSRDNGRVKCDVSGKPIYKSIKTRNNEAYIQSNGKSVTLTIRRLMAQVFLNDGDPLPRSKWVVAKDGNKTSKVLSNIEIVAASPQLCKPVGLPYKKIVQDWHLANPLDDEKCRMYVYEKYGKILSLKTIKAYRLAAGFKKARPKPFAQTDSRRQKLAHTSSR